LAQYKMRSIDFESSLLKICIQYKVEAFDITLK
jgi:hypothetical protein